MPLRSDPTLWWNLPGIVAAYQPVMCPGGPLLARYNMAHGGDNRYKMTIPSNWSFRPAVGWVTGNLSASTNYTPTSYPFTVLSAFKAPFTGWQRVIDQGSGSNRYGFVPYATSTHVWWELGGGSYVAKVCATDRVVTSAIVASSSSLSKGYIDGILSKISTSSVTLQASSFLLPFAPYTHLACAIYARELSVSEIEIYSKQIAYAGVNPDWSMWSRQRQWYYAPSAASFLASWAAGSNQIIGGGTP